MKMTVAANGAPCQVGSTPDLLSDGCHADVILQCDVLFYSLGFIVDSYEWLENAAGSIGPVSFSSYKEVAVKIG